jgi:hypothetical protein
LWTDGRLFKLLTSVISRQSMVNKIYYPLKTLLETFMGKQRSLDIE